MSEFFGIRLDLIRYDHLFEIRERRTQCSTRIEVLDYVVMTIVEFLIAWYRHSGAIGFIVRSCDIDIRCCILELPFCVFTERELETFIIGIDESEILGSHREKELLESVCEIMSWIAVDRCSVEIHEEILESHFLHSLDGFFRIGSIDIGTE